MKILFLSPWFPYPPDNGSRIRIYNLLRFLSQEHEVTLVSFSPDEPDQSGLDFCSGVYTVRRTPFHKHPLLEKLHLFLPFPIVLLPDREMWRLVRKLLKKEKFSAAIVFSSTVASYLFWTRIPKVLDLDTGLTGFALERLRLEKPGLSRLRAWLSLQKTIWAEREIVRSFDGTVVLSKTGYQSLRPILSGARQIAFAGHGVDLSHYPINLAEPEPETLIYNGSLSFYANYDAIRWFLTEVFHLIRREAPSVTLRITGKLDGVDLSDLPLSEGIQLTGYVDDVRPWVAKASVCIVPIRIGGGQRLKILEAMALGTPVVSTSKGMEGLEDYLPGEHALVADEPEDFARAVLRLLKNPRDRELIAQKARMLMETNYPWDRVLAPFRALIEKVVHSA